MGMDAGYKCTLNCCKKQHTPPNLLRYFTERQAEDRETFCMVRNPYSKLISQFGFMCGSNWGTWGQHCGSADLMNEKLLEALKYVKEVSLFKYDCHLLPQSAYVWGWNLETNTVDNSSKHCD